MKENAQGFLRKFSFFSNQAFLPFVMKRRIIKYAKKAQKGEKVGNVSFVSIALPLAVEAYMYLL